MDFPIHTIENTSEASRKLLEGSKETYGIVPNLHAVLAESPETLKGYKTLGAHFQATSFTEEERTVVWQTINVENNCHYCVPAHTAIAKSRKVDAAITEALRNRTPLPNNKLEVLRATTLELLRERGHLSQAQREAFEARMQRMRAVLGFKAADEKADELSNKIDQLEDEIASLAAKAKPAKGKAKVNKDVATRLARLSSEIDAIAKINAPKKRKTAAKKTTAKRKPATAKKATTRVRTKKAKAS